MAKGKEEGCVRTRGNDLKMMMQNERNISLHSSSSWPQDNFTIKKMNSAFVFESQGKLLRFLEMINWIIKTYEKLNYLRRLNRKLNDFKLWNAANYSNNFNAIARTKFTIKSSIFLKNINLLRKYWNCIQLIVQLIKIQIKIKKCFIIFNPIKISLRKLTKSRWKASQKPGQKWIFTKIIEINPFCRI